MSAASAEGGRARPHVILARDAALARAQLLAVAALARCLACQLRRRGGDATLGRRLHEEIGALGDNLGLTRR